MTLNTDMRAIRREQNARAQESLRERRRKKGYKLMQYWIHENDEPLVSEMVAQLREQRGGF
jgi:hypothetical protein